MDEKLLADAVLKLAEVHDRRLGEIGAAIGRLADQFTHSEEIKSPGSAIDHLAYEISNMATNVGDIGDAIRERQADSDAG